MLASFKRFLLKVIDLTALGFLEPIVRLCYGEEPKVQLKKIGQFVVVPVLAFILFLGVWAYLAPRHITKSGAVPTPAQTWDGWASALAFNKAEAAKEAAHLVEGEEREELLAYAEARLIELQPLIEQSNLAVEAAREEEKAYKLSRTQDMEERLEELKTSFRAESREREQALKDAAEGLVSEADRQAYLKDFLAFDAWEETARAEQNELKSAIALIDNEKYAPTVNALIEQTRYAEEEQFIKKLIDITSEDGREMKVASINAKLDEYRAAYAGATGEDAYKTAKRIVSQTGQLGKAEESVYVKPWTLPMQILRSIFCVFLGFIVGTAIAVPIGILCGLSRTFMAAMTPFIALFKPVSPIVWLLILWIIVGGFFPDPDNSVVLTKVNDWVDVFFGWMNGLPIVGWEVPLIGGLVDGLSINIAFIASALTVSMCSLWATMLNTALGVASVDKDHMNVARVLRLGWFSRLFKIVLPSALPLMFAGMRISLGVGWMVLVAAELLSSSEGVGKYVWDMFNNGASDSFAKIMAMIFVVGVIGLLLDRIMIIFQRAVSFEGSVAAV